MKCKICGKTTLKDNEICSFECSIKWINSEEFNKELIEFMDLDIIQWYKNQIKQHRMKIKLQTLSLQELQTDLINKIGEDKFNQFIQELEVLETNMENEESDNF